MAKVTICITHHNRLPKLKKTLDHIEAHTNSTYQVVIHNNGYINEEIRNFLNKIESDTIEIIHTDKNLGSAGSRGMLMDRTYDSEYVMIIDDDIYVSENWFQEVESIMNQDPNIGSVSFPYRFPDSDEIKGGGKKLKINNTVISLSEIEYDSVIPQPGSIEVHDTPIGTTCFRTEALDDLKYDKKYHTGFGDLDRSIKTYHSKWEARMSTSSVFIHDKTNINKDARKNRMDYNEIHDSYEYFVNKWGVRLPLPKHVYFKYIFALPNPLLHTISSIKKSLEYRS